MLFPHRGRVARFLCRLTLLLPIALAAPLLAQPTLSRAVLAGTVTDAETGLPLPGATVALPALDRGTATDPDGRFSLSDLPASPVRLVVSFVGYRSAIRTVTPGMEPLDVALSRSIVEAPDVTVTARARPSDVLSTPQSVAVVDRDALDRATGATPFDALDEVAGVRLLATGPGIAKPVVRGLTSQRVLVVHDGVRQEGQGWGDEHAPEVGAADVDRVEVVRGPLSLLYGSDALGGVVQTAPADLFAEAGAVHASAALGGTTATQQTDAALVLGGATGALGYEVRGGALRSGLVRTPDGLVPNTALDTGTLSARLGVRLGERGRVEAEAGAFRQEIGLFEAEEAALLPSTPDRYVIALPRQTVAHDRAVLRAEHALGPDRLEVTAAVQQNRRREFEDEGEAAAPEADPALSLRLTTATADLRLRHRPVGRLFGTLGASGMWQRNETLGEETLIPGGTTLNGAVYAAEHVIVGPLTLDAGARLDARHLDVEANEDLGVEAQTRSYVALTGALGAALQLRPDLSLTANVGRAFRAPVLQELFGNGVHEGTLRFERGNADLAPETSLALDGVLRYLTPHVYAEASGFVNLLDDYVFPEATEAIDPESGFVVYDFTQAEARLVGAEARLDVHPHALHGLGVHLSGDVTAGTNLDADRPLPFVPPARLQAAVEYRADRLGAARDVEVRLGPTFVAAQRRDLPEEVPTDAYTTWAASATASFAVGGATLTPTLAVENLTDATYVDPLSRYRPFGIAAPGRSVRLALRATF